MCKDREKEKKTRKVVKTLRAVSEETEIIL